MAKQYDVAVVGASLAGSAAATFLARSGAGVALIERKPDSAAYKTVCGHYIQPSALPTIERLGLMPALERAGAARGHGKVWSRYGWIDREGSAVPLSLNVRRELLDPIVRRAAAETAGVDLMQGASLEGLETVPDGSRLTLRRRDGGDEIRARLVVGADGRGSRTAELAGIETRLRKNLRCGWMGYFEDAPVAAGVGVQIWFLEPDVGLVCPTDSGLTQLIAMPHVDRIPEFKAGPEAALRRFIEALPGGPDISRARLVGKMIGKVDLTNESRAATAPGVALISDAAMASDPVAAIGCGWAFQTAEWLADAVAPALAGREPLATGLARYAQRHKRELRGHELLLSDFARRGRLSRVQRLLFSAATCDDVVAERVGAYAGRLIRPSQMLTPRVLARAAAVNLVKRRGGRGEPRTADATA